MPLALQCLANCKAANDAPFAAAYIRTLRFPVDADMIRTLSLAPAGSFEARVFSLVTEG